MVEGSLWVYGHTRLADFYEDRISFRELCNRLLALPVEAPIWDALRSDQEKAQERAQADEVERTLAPFNVRR